MFEHPDAWPLALNANSAARRKFVERFTESLINAQLAGRVNIRRAAARELGKEALQFADTDLIEDLAPFEPLAPRKAIEFFRDKIPITNEAFRTLEAEARQYAFTVSQITELNVIDTIKRQVQVSLTQGATLNDFRAAMNKSLSPEVVSRLGEFVAETIFRTNLHQAYNAGQYEELQDPEVNKAFPFYRYETVGDDRVRDSHEEVNGTVLPRDDPFWETWWPPNGFNCRCTVVPIPKKSAAKIRPDSRSQLLRTRPDPQFEGPPISLGAKAEILKDRVETLRAQVSG